jgi:hypothetical protein
MDRGLSALQSLDPQPAQHRAASPGCDRGNRRRPVCCFRRSRRRNANALGLSSKRLRSPGRDDADFCCIACLIVPRKHCSTFGYAPGLRRQERRAEGGWRRLPPVGPPWRAAAPIPRPVRRLRRGPVQSRSNRTERAETDRKSARPITTSAIRRGNACRWVGSMRRRRRNRVLLWQRAEHRLERPLEPVVPRGCSVPRRTRSAAPCGWCSISLAERRGSCRHRDLPGKGQIRQMRQILVLDKRHRAAAP